MKLLDFSSRDIGVDLGTANILITLKGKGIVSREPAVVAVDIATSEIVATGKEAREMLGRTPENIKAIKPMKDGAIADFTATGLMLKNIMKKVCKKYNTGKPRIVVGVPSGITEVEERAVEEAFFQSGAREVNLIDEPMASAIGAGLNVLEPNGKMIVDIGGGTTEVAVISFSGIVASTSIKVAGNAIDDAIIDYLKKTNNLVISQEAAENLKIDLGCAETLVSELTKEIRGRDVDTGLPKNVTTDRDARPSAGPRGYGQLRRRGGSLERGRPLGPASPRPGSAGTSPPMAQPAPREPGGPHTGARGTALPLLTAPETASRGARAALPAPKVAGGNDRL